MDKEEFSIKPFYMAMVKLKGSNKFSQVINKKICTTLSEAKVEARGVANVIGTRGVVGVFKVTETGCKQIGGTLWSRKLSK